mmetsp:Transcript_32481/g.85251  ORF Transcript_32481/g.85251 Transcript_32481/m.85251 type:complete len:546 (-) Transcript_32481:630-2267(-)
MPPASEPMSADGLSDSWVSNKSNQLRISNCFLKEIASADQLLAQQWGKTWDAMAEEHLTSRDFYERFATYLVHTYRVEKNGKHLELGSVKGIWRGCVYQSKQRFASSAREETKKFFQCLSMDSCDESVWYHGIVRQISRQIFQRKLYGGEPMDNSAEELYLEHIKELVAAFAKANTAEAALRALAILTTWRAAGRSGEAAHVSYNGMRFNALFQTLMIECPQSKASKVKQVPYVAGFDRHSDWALCFGDHLVWQGSRLKWDSSGRNLIMPELQSESGNNKLTEWIKGMQPAPHPGALAKYKHVAVESLPAHPTAAGIRPGAADTLCLFIPAEIAVHTTGHTLEGISALWNYLTQKVGLTMPGAVVLAGWPAFPYGQTGMGPKHPTLRPLVEGGVSLARLDQFIDTLFDFHDETPPLLMVGGPCRPFMHIVLATMVMYYEERFAANEMPATLYQMRVVYEKTMVALTHRAHEVLIEWGRDIRQQFITDNLHLTQRDLHSGAEQVVTAVKGLASNVSRMHSAETDMGERLLRIESAMSSLLAHDVGS